MIQGHAVPLHLSQDVPDLVQAARTHRCAEEAIVGRTIRLQPCCKDLVNELAGAQDVALRTLALDQSVEGHKVCEPLVTDLLQDLLCFVVGTIRHARVQGAIVCCDIQALTMLFLEPCEETQGAVDIAILRCGTDEPHVVLYVAALGFLKKLLRHLRVATFHGEHHQATIQLVVRFQAIRQNLPVEATSFVVTSTASVDLHQRPVDGECTHGPGLQVLGNVLGEGNVLGISALCKQAATKAFRGPEAVCLQVPEQLPCFLRVCLGVELQHRLIGSIGRLHPQLAHPLLELLRRADVVALRAERQQ
mmetsp:Transcript_26367/g.66367  ORF Transcript_26367/g.66367 Transcript_26367/m.66367 type:complete len:305 (-) Transcript_26367:967-1881(-)